MKRLMLFFLVPGVFLFTQCCNQGSTDSSNVTISTDSISGERLIIQEDNVEKVAGLIIAKYGKHNLLRIERGVAQVAALWREKDGSVTDFENFCLGSFMNSEDEQEQLFNKLSRNMEILNGNFNKINVALKEPLHLDIGEKSPIDDIFGGYDPSSHLTDDLYDNRIAFTVALNFPFYTLKEKSELGEKWTRQEWAYARVGDMFISRVPAKLLLKYAEVSSKADSYISDYNIFMGYVRGATGQSLFPEDMKLISHWNLRDELKSNYNSENGLEKQDMIFKIMNLIITQEIPECVINSNNYLWYPHEQKVTMGDTTIKFKPEPNTRYQHMLNIFHALNAMDKFNPQYPTYIQHKFEGDMEIEQEDVEQLFIDLVSSPQVRKVAKLISEKLGRKLKPYDIWYNGFTAGNSLPEEQLDKITSRKYPNAESLQKDLPNMLRKLGFNSAKAYDISSKIAVDPARGAGHAWGAEMKSDVSHLRTRIAESGMNYKGYNIAVHEFGHNVEQTLTLYDMDHYVLHGVPNTAFTEAIAFMFQKRDLELLGRSGNNADQELIMALNIFWSSYEIMGVSLVDMNVWKWLYANPEASPQELKEAVIRIAKEVWNKYYADVFGVRDQPILAIYSHMIDAPLYLSAYPIGHLVDFQLEKSIKGRNFGTEIERVLSSGKIVPQQWMRNAVGEELSVKPLLDATDEALLKLSAKN